MASLSSLVSFFQGILLNNRKQLVRACNSTCLQAVKYMVKQVVPGCRVACRLKKLAYNRPFKAVKVGDMGGIFLQAPHFPFIVQQHRTIA